jgi:DNA-binding MarR family transcriptional regulator
MQHSFDRDVLIVLHDVARLLRTRFDQRARARGMTRAQWVILARLSRQPGMSQNELAGICEVEPITVGRLVDRLEARGLVERRPDPTDRRVNRLHLLPAAQPILEEITFYRDTLSEEILDGLEDSARSALVDALLHIKNRLTAEDAELPRFKAAGA